jgi:catechol 2,3-dioxygenase-like lactoylglutathione lyase family enzyme
MSREELEAPGQIERRAFLKGLGLAATTGAVGAGTLLASRPAAEEVPVTDLKSDPLVIIWRRVLDLPTVKRSVRRINGWPLVGEDGYSVIYDAGNILVGYWNQAEFLAQESLSPAEKVALEEACADSCGCTVTSAKARGNAFNPSNQLTVAVPSTGAVAQRLGSLLGKAIRPPEARDGAGRAIAFVDDVGNTTRYLELSAAAAGGELGQRARRASGFHPVVGYELLVSDLDASRRFYEGTLGLRVDSASQDTVVLDTGNLFLTLKREPSVGLVRTIRRAGKLGDDMVVFHTEDVERTSAGLTRKGVVFPKGIEDSQHGRLAIFEDPDGHTLAAWQAPARSPRPEIDYFFVLDRLLGSAAAV